MPRTIEVDLSLERSVGPAPFPNEGVYWFLWPLFDHLASSHGKKIDLYGEVEFRTGELALIDRLIADGRKLCAAMPPSWDQAIGALSRPAPTRRIAVRVRQSEVLEWLSAIEQTVANARETTAAVRFCGD